MKRFLSNALYLFALYGWFSIARTAVPLVYEHDVVAAFGITLAVVITSITMLERAAEEWLRGIYFWSWR